MCWLWGDFKRQRIDFSDVWRPWAKKRLLWHPQPAEVHHQDQKKRGLKITIPQIWKRRGFFFVILSFFELISIFLFHFFFLFTRDSLTDSQPSKRAGSRNRKEADIKRTDRQKSTEAEHVRNKPNTQRRFVEQWGKEIWICFLVHTSPVFVCCKPFCHVCRCVHACLCTPTPPYASSQKTEGMMDISRCSISPAR